MKISKRAIQICRNLLFLNSMLHIVTPLFRYELLEKVYQSIPKYDDITWHIAKTDHRDKLTHEFISKDKRIKLYEIDCLDSDIVTKRNTIFSEIHDGYFYLLDDDTVLLNELYLVYLEYSKMNFIGMIIGRSNLLKASYPVVNLQHARLDTGMVLCHHSVLREVRWAWHSTLPRDFYFWNRCFLFFGKNATLLINRKIYYYNYNNVAYTIKKRILFFNLELKINNSILVKIYFLLADVKIKIKNFYKLHKI